MNPASNSADCPWRLVPLARQQLVHVKTQKEKRLKGPECKVLEILIQHVGKVVDKDTILAEAWAGRVVSDASLTQSIAQLRLALGDNGKEQKCIKTIPNKGYLLFENIVALCADTDNENTPKAPVDENRPNELGDGAVSPAHSFLTDPRSSNRPSFTVGERMLQAVKVVGAIGLLIVTAIHTLALIDAWTKPLQVNLNEWVESQQGEVTYVYINNESSFRLFEFILTNNAFSTRSSLSKVFISATPQNYYVACVYTPSYSNDLRVKNLSFDLEESHYFIEETMDELCQ
ncbi:hypothetical protein B6A42_25780 (plasmid) [Vibrio coralliilyticus]|nr:hypothetical protein B6A42_25780 [Vibrio coralliilyticus]